MAQRVRIIRFLLPFKLGSVNCYLVDTESGHILIDTGSANRRADLEHELENAGCTPETLKLVILTHGDFDHTGNCAHIRAQYGAKVAMHRDDAPMLERGDMFANRKRPSWVVRAIAPTIFGFGKSKRVKPDLLVDDGYHLAKQGFGARILSLPGHSKGSIGILTDDGGLYCGDLIYNVEGPVINGIMDDPAAAEASIARLERLEIGTVYPGHGEPFPMARFWETRE